MSHGGSEKPTGTEPSLGGSEERQKLIREVTAMRKQLLLFQKNEERQTEQVKKLESRVDELETEKYREVAVVSSLKIDLNLKESENKRLGQRIDQLSKQCNLLTERYTTQKQKIDTLVQHEKDFFKALQEVIDYYYDSLIGFSKFHLKSMYKLMVGEPLNVQTELKEDIIARHSKLAILNSSLEIPTIKISKKVLFKNIHQRVAFFNDLEFDRMQLTFDRILDELKRSGLKIEANDMNMSVLIDSKQSSRLRKGGSALGNPEDELNESVGDINTSQTMFLSDLEKSDLHLPGNNGKGETFGSLGECLKALKDRIKAKSGATEPDKQGLDTAEMDMVSRVIRDMSEMVDFLNSNINPGTEEKKLSSKMVSEGASTHLGDSSLSGFTITAVNHDIAPAIDENVSTATISQLVQGMVVFIKEFRTKIGAFGENNSVQLSDLEHLQKLLQEKDETNSNWNKVQVAMARLAKKINFMGEFIKEKQRILENKQLLLEKAKLTEGELVETVKSLAKELSVVEVEHRSTDHQITVLKQEKSRLLVKIDQSKKDLTRLQSDISSEQVRIDRYQSDLSLHEAQKAAQQQEAAALAEERAKLEKKLQSITEERTQSLKAMFKQKVEDMMASEKKALISTISRANEPTQGKAGGGGTVFFSLKDLHASVSTNEQLPKVKEILRGKIGQILAVMDQIESKDTAKNILTQNLDSIQHTLLFGPCFLLGYRSMLLLFLNCLRLLDQEDASPISLLKTLNELLLRTQMFESKAQSWDTIAQMKNRILDFQLEIKDGLANLIPK